MMVESPMPVQPMRMGFLQLPNYSSMAFTSAVEPLRMANQLTGKPLYEWPVITRDGKPLAASNGLICSVDGSIAEPGHLDTLIVCGGTHIKDVCDHKLLQWLRELADRRVPLGAVCTGTYLLALAGVLNGYRCTIHWENISSVREENQFPEAMFTSDLFVIDRDRYTSSGGISPLDMVLTLISRQVGQSLAEAISEEFIHDRIRQHTDQQRMPLRVRLGTSQPKLVEAVSLMESNIEEPLTLDELAHYTRISRRQLERLFKDHLGSVPRRYYLELRLKRAHQLLLQTSMSMIDVAMACGFTSPSHFSKCYHEFYGVSPSEDRRRRYGPARDPFRSAE